MRMRSLSKLYGNAGKRLWNEDPEPTFDPIPEPERQPDESEVMYVQRRIDWRRMSDRLWKQEEEYKNDANKLTNFLDQAYGPEARQSLMMDTQSHNDIIDRSDYKTLYNNLKAECTVASASRSASDLMSELNTMRQTKMANGSFQLYIGRYEQCIRELEIWGVEYKLPDVLLANYLYNGVDPHMFDSILKQYVDAGREWTYEELRDKLIKKYKATDRDNERESSNKIRSGEVSHDVKAYKVTTEPTSTRAWITFDSIAKVGEVCVEKGCAYHGLKHNKANHLPRDKAKCRKCGEKGHVDLKCQKSSSSEAITTKQVSILDTNMFVEDVDDDDFYLMRHARVDKLDCVRNIPEKVEDIEYTMDTACIEGNAVYDERGLSDIKWGKVKVFSAHGVMSMGEGAGKLPLAGSAIVDRQLLSNLISTNTMHTDDTYAVETKGVYQMMRKCDHLIILKANYMIRRGYICRHKDLLMASKLMLLEKFPSKQRILQCKNDMKFKFAHDEVTVRNQRSTYNEMRELGLEIPRTFTPHQKTRSLSATRASVGLGYPTAKILGQMADGGELKKCDFTSRDVNNAEILYGPNNVFHLMGHSNARAASGSTKDPATRPGEHLAIDPKKFTVQTIGGGNQAYVAVDEFTSYMIADIQPSKSVECTKAAESIIVSHFNQFGWKVDRLSTDHEATLLASKEHMQRMGIVFDQTVPGRHQTLVERAIQTLCKQMQTILASLNYKPPEKLHGELMHHSINLINMRPNVKTSPHSPMFLVEKVRPSIPKHGWGTIGVFQQRNETKNTRTETGIIVGYDNTDQNRYRVFLPESDRVVVRLQPQLILTDPLPEWNYAPTIKMRPNSAIITRSAERGDPLPPNVNCKVQGDPPISTTQKKEEFEDVLAERQMVSDNTRGKKFNDENISESMSGHNESIQFDDVHETESTSAELQNITTVTRGDNYTDTETINPVDTDAHTDTAQIAAEREPVGRSMRSAGISQRKNYNKYRFSDTESIRANINNINYDDVSNVPDLIDDDSDSDDETDNCTPKYNISSINVQNQSSERDDKPTDDSINNLSSFNVQDLSDHYTLKRGLQTAKKDLVRQAANAELENMLHKHKALEAINYMDIAAVHRHEIMILHMFFKDKVDANGVFIKTKARLIIGGDKQKKDTYNNIASPTATPATLMTQLQLITTMNMEWASMDVPAAFLVPTMPESTHFYGVMDPITAQLAIKLRPTLEAYLGREGKIYFRLRRYLYGLHQSSMIFYNHVIAHGTGIGLQVSKLDRCMMFKHEAEGLVMIVFHVDDMLICTPNKLLLEKYLRIYKRDLNVEITRGSTLNFLGMTLERDLEKHTLKVTMKNLITYLPTKEMICDMLNKVLNGPALRRNMIGASLG